MTAFTPGADTQRVWEITKTRGPTMNGLARETRLQIMLDDEELAVIDDWRFKRRMPSRASAIRELLRRGIAAELGADTDRFKRSGEFGVIPKDDELEP